MGTQSALTTATSTTQHNQHLLRFSSLSKSLSADSLGVDVPLKADADRVFAEAKARIATEIAEQGGRSDERVRAAALAKQVAESEAKKRADAEVNVRGEF